MARSITYGCTPAHFSTPVRGNPKTACAGLHRDAPRASRAVCMRWMEDYLAHASIGAGVVDTDLRGAHTGNQTTGQPSTIKQALHARQSRTGKQRRTAFAAPSSSEGKRKSVPPKVLFSVTTCARPNAHGQHAAFVTGSQRLPGSPRPLARSAHCSGQGPSPAGRAWPQVHFLAARTRRGAARGGTHEASEVTDDLEPALHLTTVRTRAAQATRQRGAFLVSPAQLAPATRRASEGGAWEQHKRTQTRRMLPRSCTRTFPRVGKLFRGAYPLFHKRRFFLFLNPTNWRCHELVTHQKTLTCSI